MDIENLEYYIAICTYNNITKAAEKMHISQSSLSRRLASLEAELGAELINRQSGKFELTPAGAVLLEDAHKIVKQQSKTIERINREKNRDAVRIGYSHNMYMRGFMDRITRIRESFPDKELVFQENSAKKIQGAFLERQLDIIYTSLAYVDGLPDVEIYTVAENALAVMVPRGHRLWNRTSIKLEELEGETICVLDDDVAGTKVNDDLFVLNDSLSNVNRLMVKSPYDALMYSCICGYLSLSGVIGNTEKELHQDKVRTIRLECQEMHYGDQVLAYRKDDEIVRELMKTLK